MYKLSDLKPAPSSPEDRAQGSLLGLAIGDALGTTLEFKPPRSFAPLTDMVGGGPFQLEPGQWTDDTSMALCLAESLIELRCFNPTDQLERYVRWWREGHLSSTGTCFDIGATVSNALTSYLADPRPYAGSTDPNSAGNGSLMRLAPVPLFYSHDADRAMEYSARSSRTTHGANAAVNACRYYGGLIFGALNGSTKDELLTPCYAPQGSEYWTRHPLDGAIAEIADGSFKYYDPPDIEGTGYVVRSLEAALWAFYHSSNFADGALLAVNLGDDADTTGAIYGQLAGAYYGAASMPSRWLCRLTRVDYIASQALKLLRRMG